jgi:hypothetical protein
MTGSDLRFALRRLVRHRSASLAAVLTLALGIGAITALFSTVRPVLLEPPAFRAPDELVQVALHARGQTETPLEISYPDYRDWRRESRSLTRVRLETDRAAGNGRLRSIRARMVRPVHRRDAESAEDAEGCGAPGPLVSCRLAPAARHHEGTSCSYAE